MKRFLVLAAGAILLFTILMFWSDPTLSGRLEGLWICLGAVIAIRGRNRSMAAT
jgi:hypothetical protein